MKTIVIGAVNSTKHLIEEMIRLSIPINMIFGLDESISANVSGYYPLRQVAKKYGIPYRSYTRINDEENIKVMALIEPDYIFAIGFSQLVSESILKIPKRMVVGMHPAPLPKFRGRAVIVWQMLSGVKNSKITMFKIDAGADSGDIIDQEPFSIDEEDYAGDVLNKAHEASIVLFRRVLKNLTADTYKLTKQDDSLATYCLKRTPSDGCIDWTCDRCELLRFIRAVSRPYPGAFSYYDGEIKVVFWRAHVEDNDRYYGFPGQIAEVSGSTMIIVLKDGLLCVEEYEIIGGSKLLPGHRFMNITR